MNRLKAFKDSAAFPFFLLFLVYFAVHLLCTVNFNDDLVFAQIQQSDIPARLKWNYFNWSTRLVIEFVYYNLYHLPLLVWKLLDSLALVLIAWCILRLLAPAPTQRAAYLSCAAVMLYPFLQMDNAGWISTTANYTWPLALGLYALTYLRNLYDGRPVRWWQHLLYLPALIYSGNAEQVVSLLLAFYVILTIYFIVKRKFRVPLVLHMAILLFMFLFKVTGPANSFVNLHVARTYYPDYYSLDLLDRIINTLTATCSHFVKYANPLLLLLLLLLCVLVFYKYTEPLYRAVAAIPLIVCAGLALFANADHSQFYAFSVFEEGFITLENFNHLAEYVPLATYLLLICAIMINLYLVWGATEKMILGQLIFLGGLATRMIMSFSSSVYASNMRTFASMYFCLIALLVMLLLELSSMAAQPSAEGASLARADRWVRGALYTAAVWTLYNVLIAL